MDLLRRDRVSYCVIGGLAVNAYVEPVVSLDLDIVIVATAIDDLLQQLPTGFAISKHAQSINVSHKDSALRIQIQTDPRYQAFVGNAVEKDVLGYQVMVASLPDLLKGKSWVYLDPGRRRSKQQKDLADILRIIEAYPKMEKELPTQIKQKI